MTAIFVYGTLKRGGTNHHYLSGQEFVAKARTIAGYTLYQPADYPGLVSESDDTAGVEGEIWHVTSGCLQKLDALEGIPEKLYERKPIKLAPPHHELKVETYFYLRPLKGCPHLGSTWPAP